MKLTVQGLSKEYRSFARFRERLLAAFSLGLFSGTRRMRALSDLSFEAGSEEHGEILGIIGPNGAGKSTLLRILSGISPPSAGSVRFAGNVRSILELGVGFSADLTGRQNIYYNGRLWGYSGRQLLQAMDQILDFARLHDYADVPLSAYSTGMQMRLGFALATYQRSDLLLIDEALAVGDAAFQQRCIRRFEEFRQQGSLIIVVGHDLHMLQAVCDRILLLDRGRAVFLGSPGEAGRAYMDLIAAGSFDGEPARALEEQEFRLRLVDAGGRDRSVFVAGERAVLEITLQPGRDLEKMTVGIHINDGRGLRASGVNSRLLGQPDLNFPAGRGRRLRFALRLNLGPGKYAAGFSVHRGIAHATDCYLWREDILPFEIESPGDQPFEGMSYLEPTLEIEDD
ncbi:MAG: ABC transporter ATP-binding protein [Leptospiraceae bacterium]|nr:ABC transporter ATP-binding protein [Leptospiraceae bacterium]